jgi:Zn-dependent protease
VLDASTNLTSRSCARCGTELSDAALVCPVCSTLVHRDRLRVLAEQAVAAASGGDQASARTLWQEARDLLPPHSQQHAQIGSRLAELGEEPATTATASGDGEQRGVWRRAAAAAAALGFLAMGKVKFLLLGLGKLSTFSSMFGFIAVYWSIYGWPLAAGLAGSIYVHEMGHVSVLRRLGIRADAPLFIPGVGALVMLKEHVTDPITNARIGLAGPMWGLGAAVAAWAVHVTTEAPIWRAIAELTGFMNLFNLIPIWQLDGSRGFDALSGSERVSMLGVIGLTLAVTDLGLLWIVGAVALYRTVASQPGPGHPPTFFTFAALVATLSWFARSVT